ncbi:MAG TPA: hypothetical protein EYM57_03365 [Gammaproteobacteria bacterium]|nr:hypothetical protein [Gammaproteobacteria bacterium]
MFNESGEFSIVMFLLGTFIMGFAVVAINTLSNVLAARKELKKNLMPYFDKNDAASHGLPFTHGIVRSQPGRPGVKHDQTIAKDFVALTTR